MRLSQNLTNSRWHINYLWLMRGCVCPCVCVCDKYLSIRSPHIYPKLCTHAPRLGGRGTYSYSPSHTRCKHALGCRIYYVLSIIKWAQCKCATHKLIFIIGSNAKPNANATRTCDRDSNIEGQRQGQEHATRTWQAPLWSVCLFLGFLYPLLKRIEG